MSPTYTGDNITSNLVAVGAGYQATGYYQAGVLAGKMTQTNATGVIIGQWFDALSFEFYAYQAGVHSVNPNAKVYLTVPGTWSDPTIGYQDAQTMISTNHVDIIVPIADATGRGVISAAIAANISIIGTVEDQVSTSTKQHDDKCSTKHYCIHGNGHSTHTEQYMEPNWRSSNQHEPRLSRALPRL